MDLGGCDSFGRSLEFSDIGLVILLVFGDSFTPDLALRTLGISVGGHSCLTYLVIWGIIRKSNRSHSFQHMFHLSYIDMIVYSHC